MRRLTRIAASTTVAVSAMAGLAVLTAPAALAATSCSGTITYDHTYNVGGNPVAELTIYYNSTNGGTNSACLYHRGAYYGKSEPTAIQIYRCTQQATAPGSPCTIAVASRVDSNNYAYYAGPVGVTGTANYCVAVQASMGLTGGGELQVGTGTRGCPGIQT
ncbi:MAG: hypothetical protein ABI140_04100 [Jatrophihabitantaceae bacterium]